MKKGIIMLSISFLVILCIKALQATEYCSSMPLTGISVRPNCFRSGTNSVICWDPIKEGTIAQFSCAEGYKRPKGVVRDTIFCNSGRWNSKALQCEPICGMRDDRYEKNAAWHALIYVKLQKYFKCGGTIISVKLVISAAHCVWNGTSNTTIDKSSIEIHVGKTDLQFYYGNTLEVTEILIPEGKSRYNENDIAIIIVENFIEYTAAKLPVCIDWSDDNEKLVENGVKGFVPTAESNEHSNQLYYAECEYNTRFDNDTVYEVHCETTFTNMRNCSTDSGGGYVVQKIINGVKTYFLKGIIITNTFTNVNSCPNNFSATIVNIQQHSGFILSALEKYTVNQDLARSKKISCEIPFIPKLKIVLDGNYIMRRNVSAGESVDGLNKIIYSCENNYQLIGTRTNYCYYDRWYKTGKWAENHPVCIEIITRHKPIPTLACEKPNISNLKIFDWTWREITEDYVEENNRIRYKCDKNNHLNGKLENVCDRGKWMWEHPSCLNIFVSPPSEEKCGVPFIPNTVIILEGLIKKNLSVGNYVENENSISYSCTEEHLLHGGSSNYCHEGKWLSEHPSCIKFIISTPTKDDCEVPYVPNGVTILDTIVRVNESSPSFVRNYQQISYRCKTNFLLQGESTNVCYYNGVWRNEHPRCTKITADDCEIPAIPNLTIVLEGEINKVLSFGSYVENFNIISYSCKENHLLQGRGTNNCIRGKWTDEHPTCIKYCPNDILKGVTISAICEFKGVRISCDQYLRAGTIAKIFCQYGYKKPDQLAPEAIICEESGRWDYEPFRCEPICGTEHSETVPYIKGGEKANITAVPWHAAIYSFVKGRYTQICGGTIISSRVIVSAAHCFWHGPDIPVDHSKILVGVGKYYRDYVAEESLIPQFFNVSEIYVPDGYQGPLQAYHDDIAILVLIGHIEYKPYIKPICVQELGHEEKAIHSGLIGRVAGWGKTRLDVASEELQMLEISTLSYTDCVNAVDPRFRTQIAADKFCVSSLEEESVCAGDSGGGFVIPKVINEVKTYFLWGIVSNGLTDRHDCEGVNLTSLTNIQHYYDKILHYQKKFGIK